MIISGRSIINLIILFISLFSIYFHGTACCKTISICENGCDFDRITDAIDEASPGDTLQVRSGIYRENVNVSKALTLLGEDTGSGMPTVDGGENGSAMALFADGITVDGFNVTDSLGSWLEIWAGIEVNSNHNIIRNNLAFNNENGILIYGANNTIQGNNASNNLYGIKARSAGNNSIAKNILRNNNYGLHLLSSDNNMIQGNLAWNNEYGLLLNQSSGNNLAENLMTGNVYNFGCHGKNQVALSNLADGKPIYYLIGSSNREINSSQDAATVFCIDCRNLTVRGLDLKNNFYGIYLENSSHSSLQGNNISHNRIGSALINSNRNSLKSNQAMENAEGFLLSGSRYNTLESNKATDNQAGLDIVHSEYNNILGNSFQRNEKGLLLSESGENLLSGNSFISNSIGAELSSAWFNQLLENNVGNSIQGILLDPGANDNNLSSNRIFNNQKGILYDPLDNNTIGIDNLFWNDTVNLTEITDRQTAGPIPSSIAIVIDANPEDAIIISGDEHMKAPGPLFFSDPGEYNVLVQKKGYRDGNLTIKIPDIISSKSFTESMWERSIELIPEES
jgi:parallel beta-helix repeat protein